MISNDNEEAKLQVLTDYIESRRSALVALSGGIDSMLLSLLAHRVLGSNAHAATVVTEFFIQREASFIERFVDEFHVSHSFLEIGVLENEHILSNPENRCYHCKRLICENLLRKAHEKGLAVVFDGTNVDDLGEDRPGIRALHELGVVSPYLEAGVGKQEILRYAASCGLKSCYNGDRERRGGVRWERVDSERNRLLMRYERQRRNIRSGHVPLDGCDQRGL